MHDDLLRENAYANRMDKKMTLVEEQRRYLEAILRAHNLTLTEISKQIGVSSTTLTRWYNGNPKHALSATTIDKIKSKYPEVIIRNNLTDAEIALVDAFQIIMQVLVRTGLVTKESFIRAFIYLKEHYKEKELPNAIMVMEGLISHSEDLDSSPDAQVIRRLLQLSPIKER